MNEFKYMLQKSSTKSFWMRTWKKKQFQWLMMLSRAFKKFQKLNTNRSTIQLKFLIKSQIPRLFWMLRYKQELFHFLNCVKVSCCLSILTKILKNESLYEKVRGRNGAYSVEASYNQFTGNFLISSRRDTVPLKNYKVILESVQNIESYITDEKV